MSYIDKIIEEKLKGNNTSLDGGGGVGKTNGLIKDMGDAFKSGLYSTTGGIVKALSPDFWGGLLYSDYDKLDIKPEPTVDPDTLLKKATEAAPKLDMDIIGSFQDKDYSGAVYKMLVGTASSIPQLAAMVGSSAVGAPEVGMAMIGASSTGGTYAELEERPDLSESTKRRVALAHGAIEILANYVTVNPALNKIFRGGSPQAKEGVKHGIKKFLTHALENEMAEEVITQMSQDLVDNVTGVSDLTSGQMVRRAGNAGLAALIPGSILKGVEIAAAYKYGNVETKGADIDQMTKIGTQHALKNNIDPNIVTALMKVESDFRDVGNNKTSAKGPLQVTDNVLKDFDRLNIHLENNIGTLDGKIEAGVKYLKVLRDYYHITDPNELIASYFAGPTYIKEHGITNEILDGHQSPAGYVRAFQEAHKTLLGIETDVDTIEQITSPKEQTDLSVVEAAEVVQESPVLTHDEAIKQSLVELGYRVNQSEVDGLDVDTLSSLYKYQLDVGIWDSPLDNYGSINKETAAKMAEQVGEINPELAKALTEEVKADDGGPYVDIPSDDPRKYNSYWDMYENWCKDQMVKAYGKNFDNAKEQLIGELKNKNLVDWILSGKERTQVVGTDLELMGTPAKTGAAINTNRVIADDFIKQGLETIGQLVDSKVPRTTFDQINQEFKQKYGSFDKENIENSIRKFGLMDKDAKKLTTILKDAPALTHALRQSLVAVQTDIEGLAQKIRSSSANDLEKVKFIQLLKLNQDMTTDFKHISRNIAQTLSSFRMNVGGRSLSMLDLDVSQLRYMVDDDTNLTQTLDRFGGDKKVKDLADKIVNSNFDPKVITEVSQDSKFTKFLRALTEWRTANLLRNLATGFKNASSQTFNVMYEDAVNFVSATIGTLRIKTKRKIDTSSYDSLAKDLPMTFKQAFASSIAGWEGVFKSLFKPVVPIRQAGELMLGRSFSAFDLAKLAMLNPAKFEEVFEKALLSNRIEVESQHVKRITSEYLFPNVDENTTIGGLMSSFVNRAGALSRMLGFGVVQVTDIPFTYQGYYSKLGEQLAVLAMVDHVKEMQHKVRQKYLNEIKEGVITLRRRQMLEPLVESKVTTEMLGTDILERLSPVQMDYVVKFDKEAKKHSDYMTWKDKMGEGWTSTVEKGINRHPLARLAIPFTHTGLKILEKGVDSLGASKDFWHTAIKGVDGKRAQTHNLGRIIVTGGVISVGLMLFKSGQLTPPARNPRERERMIEDGLPPSSIKLGDTWYDYSQMMPFPGLALSSMSAAYRAVVETYTDEGDEATILEKTTGIATSTFQSLTKAILNQTMLTSLSSLFDVMSGQGVLNYFLDMVKSFHPNYTFQNNYKRMKWGGLNPFYQEYQYKDDGIVKRDRFGKPKMQYKAMMGIRMYDDSRSPIREELEKLNLTLPKLSNVFRSTKMTETQYQELLRFFGEEVKAEEEMNKIVASSQYRKASDLGKRKILLRAWKGLKDKARYTLSKDPEFIEKLLQRQQRQVTENLLSEKGYLPRYVPGQPIDNGFFESLIKMFKSSNSGGD